jgi:hypothetical protein
VRDILRVIGAAGLVGGLAQISMHLSFTPVPITGPNPGRARRRCGAWLEARKRVAMLLPAAWEDRWSSRQSARITRLTGGPIEFWWRNASVCENHDINPGFKWSTVTRVASLEAISAKDDASLAHILVLGNDWPNGSR